ncbi:hypothetical protein BH20ACI3_BH20ACI3_20540 [soil metagenome]
MSHQPSREATIRSTANFTASIFRWDKTGPLNLRILMTHNYRSVHVGFARSSTIWIGNPVFLEPTAKRGWWLCSLFYLFAREQRRTDGIEFSTVETHN